MSQPSLTSLDRVAISLNIVVLFLCLSKFRQNSTSKSQTQIINLSEIQKIILGWAGAGVRIGMVLVVENLSIEDENEIHMSQ